MFMRFFQLEIKPEFVNEFKKFYEYIVFPKLQKTLGCLFAGLIKSGPKENSGKQKSMPRITKLREYFKNF